ncbi:MAG: DUF1289 domain-containing protein [Pseudomonadota bacterium]|nr:DUF1289 domain-containing protein [Pseudomonadota bacterium]
MTTHTPCAGRCSTVFGDSVCRGCRRFSHEVIDWNRYTSAQRDFIWLRLDQQLDQIILPLIPLKDRQQLIDFLHGRQIALPVQASLGRQIYEALRLCQRAPERCAESGLNITAAQVSGLWQQAEQRLYALAVASFEFAWLRAANMHHV